MVVMDELESFLAKGDVPGGGPATVFGAIVFPDLNAFLKDDDGGPDDEDAVRVLSMWRK